MATLEDAAEELVVKLKGLDAEIEDSRQALGKLQEKVEHCSQDVEQEWSRLTEAVESLRARAGEEQETLASTVEKAEEALAEAGRSVEQGGGEARSEVAEVHGRVDAIGQKTAGHEPGVDSLITEAGEAPARSLAAEAQEIGESLATVLRDAAEFLEQEGVELEQIADQARARCDALHESLAEGALDKLQAAYDAWEAKLDELEAHVAAQGFVASRGHARAVVSWALGECRRACEEHLDGLEDAVAAALRPIEELADLAGDTAEALIGCGAELVAGLGETRSAGGGASAALEAVTALLARYSFVEV